MNKNNKIFSLLFLFAFISVIFISGCESKQDPESIGYYAGDWYDKTNTNDKVLTVNSDGSLTIAVSTDATTTNPTISGGDITATSGTSFYFYYGEREVTTDGVKVTVRVKFAITFSSDTEGTLKATGEGETNGIKVTDIPLGENGTDFAVDIIKL